MNSRRAILLGLVGGLSGCVGVLDEPTPTPTPTPIDSDNDGVPDEEDDYPDSFLRAERVKQIDEQFELSPGGYKAIKVNARGATHWFEYDLLVTNGPAIDVYLFERSEYVKYPDGEPKHLTEYGGSGYRSVEIGQPLSEGTYVLVVDYTERGTLPKSSSVSIDLQLELAKPSPD